MGLVEKFPEMFSILFIYFSVITDALFVGKASSFINNDILRQAYIPEVREINKQEHKETNNLLQKNRYFSSVSHKLVYQIIQFYSELHAG